MRWCLLLVCFGVSACGLVTEQSFYEGLRTQQRAQSPNQEPSDKALPNYDQYKKERDAIKSNL